MYDLLPVRTPTDEACRSVPSQDAGDHSLDSTVTNDDGLELRIRRLQTDRPVGFPIKRLERGFTIGKQGDDSLSVSGRGEARRSLGALRAFQ